MGNFLKNIHPLLRRGKHNDVYDDSNFAVLNALNYELTLAERETIESKIQSSLETATGEYLDEWGDWFGVYRKDGWSDDYYRKRIIRELLLKRGTIPAIIDAIKDFLEDNDANISIYEPWRNIFYTNKSKLNGEDHLMGYYYRFAIIDITIDRPFSPAIIEVIKAFKPAGVLFYLRLDTSLNPNNVPVDSPYVYLDVTNKTELERWTGLTYDINGNINLSNQNKTVIDDNIFHTNRSHLNGTDVLAGSFNHGRGYLHLASDIVTEQFTPTGNTTLSDMKLSLVEASQDMYIATDTIDNRSAQVKIPPKVSDNLVDPDYLAVYSAYGTNIVISKDKRSLKTTVLNNALYFALRNSLWRPEKQTYVLTGTMLINGLPVTANQFDVKRASTYNSSVANKEFTITDTGKFKIVEDYVGSSQWIIYAKMFLTTGDVIEIQDFKIEAVNDYGKYKMAWANSPDGATDFTNSYPTNNLLRGSGDFSLGAIRPTDIQEETFRGNAVLRNVVPAPGTTSYRDIYNLKLDNITPASSYTLSFWARAENDNDVCRCYFYSPNTTGSFETNQGTTGSAVDGQVRFTLSTNWEQYWVKWKQGTPATPKTVIIGRQSISDGIGTIYISSPMFVAGDTPMPWRSAIEDNKPETSLMQYKGIATATSTNYKNYDWFSINYTNAYTYVAFDVRTFVATNYSEAYNILVEELGETEALNTLLSNPVISSRIRALVTPSSPIDFELSLYDFASNSWFALGSSKIDTNYHKYNMEFNRAVDYINSQGLLFIQMKFVPTFDYTFVELDMLNMTFNYRLGAGYSIGLQTEIIGGMEIPATGIIANPKTITIGLGEQTVLGATLVPDNATVSDVVYESENPQIASVSTDGRITPVSVGTTTITVYGDDKRVSDTCTVTVVIRPENVKLDKSALYFESAKVSNPNLLRGVFYNKPEVIKVNKGGYYYQYYEPMLQRRIPLKPDTTYTLSWKYKWISGDPASNQTVSVGLGRANSMFGTDLKPQREVTAEILTFTTPSDLSANPYFALRLSRVGTPFSQDSVSSYTNLKLEEGTEATPWVPNIADTVAPNVMSITETNNYMNLATVSKNIAGRTIQVDSTGTEGAGLALQNLDKIKWDTDYILGFNFTVNSGAVGYIGGHAFDIAQISSISINGSNYTGSIGLTEWYTNGVAYNFAVGTTYKIVVKFKTKPSLAGTGTHGIFIQPNRNHYGDAYSASISYLYMIESVLDTGWLPAIEDGTF